MLGSIRAGDHGREYNNTFALFTASKNKLVRTNCYTSKREKKQKKKLKICKVYYTSNIGKIFSVAFFLIF